MKQRRSIFRPEALRRYAENQEKAILPRLVNPRAFIALWLLLGVCLFAAGIVTWSIKERLSQQTTEEQRSR